MLKLTAGAAALRRARRADRSAISNEVAAGGEQPSADAPDAGRERDCGASASWPTRCAPAWNRPWKPSAGGRRRCARRGRWSGNWRAKRRRRSSPSASARASCEDIAKSRELAREQLERIAGETAAANDRAGRHRTRRASKPVAGGAGLSGSEREQRWPRAPQRAGRRRRARCASSKNSASRSSRAWSRCATASATVKLKEQAAAAQRRAVRRSVWSEAQADEAVLAPKLDARADGSACCRATSPGSSQEIAELGAVNLAALEELDAARERKGYLDAQSADLTEAINTLEDAIRRIDRETREQLQRHLRHGEQALRRAVPGAVRRRRGRAGADRRGNPRCRRPGHRAAAGQEELDHPPAVRRREGADGHRAGVLDVPAQSGAVLPAGRGGCAARRHQHRALLRHGEAHVGSRRSSCSSPTTRSPWKWRSS